ncbi:hypothetical protein Holit_02547 [Hollandina sp. SP2]
MVFYKPFILFHEPFIVCYEPPLVCYEPSMVFYKPFILFHEPFIACDEPSIEPSQTTASTDGLLVISPALGLQPKVYPMQVGTDKPGSYTKACQTRKGDYPGIRSQEHVPARHSQEGTDADKNIFLGPSGIG